MYKNLNFHRITFFFPLFLYLFYFFIFFSCTNESDNTMPEPKKVEPKTPQAEYTIENAGEWESIKEEHLPMIKVFPKLKKDNIEIKVEGKFTEQHYIERIGIMDENKQDLAGMSLKKNQKPEVLLTLDPIPDNPNVKVYVKCNLHDLWTQPIVH